MENSYLSVVSDQKRKLKFKPLKRTSHYLMENPSVFLNDSYINFSASAFKRLGFDKYKHCCLLYTSPSPRDLSTSRMPSSA